jgi:hypothetical protein
LIKQGVAHLILGKILWSREKPKVPEVFTCKLILLLLSKSISSTVTYLRACINLTLESSPGKKKKYKSLIVHKEIDSS